MSLNLGDISVEVGEDIWSLAFQELKIYGIKDWCPFISQEKLSLMFNVILYI